jgi:hypothetical protein
MKTYAVALHLTSTKPDGRSFTTIDLTFKNAISSAEALGMAIIDVKPEYVVGAFKVAEIVKTKKEVA